MPVEETRIDQGETIQTMKTILCYGDSNTWGYNPGTGERYKKEERWPGVLRNTLGEGFGVIEEGLNGRTTVWDDPIEGWKNGKTYLLPCLHTHKPLDLVIIFLGTNDLKTYFSLPAYAIAEGASALVKIVQKSETGHLGGPPQVLLLAPPPLGHLDSEQEEKYKDGRDKSRMFSSLYREAAETLGCHFFDTSKVIFSSKVDGVHLDKPEHENLGTALAGVVRMILRG
jgi:lysophospholipase L1-like esterase